MGLSWIFELVSWAVGGPDYYWYGTDVINLLRAAFIFITLCCKREVGNLSDYNIRIIHIQGDPDHPEAMFFSETVGPIEMR